LLRERARRHPDRVAVIGPDQQWTYAELDRRASALAAGLLKLGLKKGDRVLVHLPNIPEFISVIFALFRTGMIPVYALPAHRITEIEHFASNAAAVGYIGVDQHAGFDYRVMLRELRTRCPQLQHIVVHGQAEEFIALDHVRASGAGIDIPA